MQSSNPRMSYLCFWFSKVKYHTYDSPKVNFRVINLTSLILCCHNVIPDLDSGTFYAGVTKTV